MPCRICDTLIAEINGAVDDKVEMALLSEHNRGISGLPIAPDPKQEVFDHAIDALAKFLVEHAMKEK